MTNNEIIGNKINDLKIKKGIGKFHFSKKTGISRPTLDRIYSGDLNTSLMILKRILMKGF